MSIWIGVRARSLLPVDPKGSREDCDQGSNAGGGPYLPGMHSERAAAQEAYEEDVSDLGQSGAIPR